MSISDELCQKSSELTDVMSGIVTHKTCPESVPDIIFPDTILQNALRFILNLEIRKYVSINVLL